ncbi:MAG: M48 family metallopeptidase [Firmicutes bacterium]|nr:M48 family metallopeptidase [Bacillota bacterium]MCM1400625.1 M48 family metallopeptidase [Bacteroides sp.]MCM1477780.1 M48 family metallopeptidase [Bacteroides sp.]
MKTPIQTPLRLSHPTFGAIAVTPRRNMTRIIVRAAGAGSYKASVPFGIDLQQARPIILELVERLALKQSRKPPFSYQPGWIYSYPEGEIRILTGSSKPRHIVIRPNGNDIEVFLGTELPPSDSAVIDTIRKGLLRLAQRISARILLPQAAERAAQLGLHNIAWETGHATSQLGCCYRRGRRIRLSGLLLFLPVELRLYVINHELAHLTHHNHSTQFHELCNSYCLGRETELARLLKAWNWPFPLH